MRSDEMLRAAADLVAGDRAKDYGNKAENHQRIADLWNLWLHHRKTTAISSYDVAMMMLLLKVARLAHKPGHQDSHVDLAGYASILEEISNGAAGE